MHIIVNKYLPRTLVSVLVISLLLPTPVAAHHEYEVKWEIRIEELPLVAVSPGGASDFRYEYSFDGERLLFRGWEGPNDIRVMDRNLTLVKEIELPTEDFKVQGARWDYDGNVIVWGQNETGNNGTILVYRQPDLELDTDFMPREVIPLSTIDSVMLLASGYILMVVGRDASGTSQIVALETRTDSVRSTHDVHGNLSIQMTGLISAHFIALDVEGGATMISTYNWTYHDRIVDIEGPYSFARLRTNHPWMVGGQNGHVLIKEDYMVNRTFDMTFDEPALAATWLMASNVNNYVVALPRAGGGSVIKVYHDRNGTFELGDEMETEGTVTTMYAVTRLGVYPSKVLAISVGFAHGEFREYNVTNDRQEIPILHLPEPVEMDDEKEGNSWKGMLDPDWNKVIPSTAIIVVLVVVIYRIRTGNKKS